LNAVEYIIEYIETAFGLLELFIEEYDTENNFEYSKKFIISQN